MNTISYGYAESGWKDRMTSYAKAREHYGKAVVYNANGLETFTMEWETVNSLRINGELIEW